MSLAVFTIAGRELRGILNTTIGWMVMCGYLLITGIFWVALVTNYVTSAQDVVFNPYGASQLSLSDHLLMPFFGNCTIVLVFVAPALSMRMYAEEFRQRTMELLFTSPVSTLEIVVGKYLGAMAFVVVMLLATAHVPLSLLYWGDPDPGVIGGGYLGLFLMTSALVALGGFFSSLSTNQIVALVLSFAVSLGLYIGSWLGDDPEGWILQLSLATHLEDVLRGALRLSDLVYFAAFVFVALFATHQRMESFRWR